MYAIHITLNIHIVGVFPFERENIDLPIKYSFLLEISKGNQLMIYFYDLLPICNTNNYYRQDFAYDYIFMGGFRILLERGGCH